jgi:hypothetical protein
LSGPQREELYKAKHLADSESHLAISQWYAGTALVELLDVDRLFSDVPDREKAEDFVLLKKSAGHLRQAAQHWETSSRECLTVANLVSETAEGLLLKEDIQTFQKLAQGALYLATEMEKGVLPPNTPVHALTALMRDQDVMAERRARAYQGLPGHLPANYK